MPSYSPTITLNNNPAISVTMAGNLTYNEFVTSLGCYIYLVNSMYMQAYDFQQLNQTATYTAFDATGYLFSNAIPMVPSPYQFQPTILLESPTFAMVLNGRSNVAFNIDPGERVQMVMLTDEISFSGMLDTVSANNFQLGKQIDDDLGNLELFEHYKTTIS